MINKGQDDALTAKQQRWLAVGLLLIVSLIVGSLILVPVISKGLVLNEAKNNLVFRAQQYERILAKKDAVIASREHIKQQSEAQVYFNKQGTEALASAEMQEWIKKTIVDAGGQPSSTQTIPSADNGATSTAKFNRIIVRISMTGSSETLRTVLYKIETTTDPLMIIDQIDIRPVRGRRNRVTGQIDASNELAINFQAVSFMRKPPQ
jgi:general secretion pathway protein M